MTIRMIHLTMPGTAGHLPDGPRDFDYDRTMTSSSYFRFPHVHGDLVTFVAEDDVWIAPLGGGRAWRVSSLQLPARNPRFTPGRQAAGLDGGAGNGARKLSPRTSTAAGTAS